MNKEKILGFDVVTYNSKELLNKIYEDYLNNEQLFIVNVNPEIISKNYKKEKFKEILNKQKYQIPDGSGIVWASKRKKGQIKERITGIDFMIKICEKFQEGQAKIFLYGAKQEVIEKTQEELKKAYPQINIVGQCNGYIDEKIALEKIKKSDADIVFVGLGSPKQEEFIIKYKDELPKVKILMPVGGSFDVISKTKKRAPNWMIRINLEWLYRLFQEPKRIFRQINLIKYIYLIIKSKGEENGEN